MAYLEGGGQSCIWVNSVVMLNFSFTSSSFHHMYFSSSNNTNTGSLVLHMHACIVSMQMFTVRVPTVNSHTQYTYTIQCWFTDSRTILKSIVVGNVPVWGSRTWHENKGFNLYKNKQNRKESQHSVGDPSSSHHSAPVTLGHPCYQPNLHCRIVVIRDKKTNNFIGSGECPHPWGSLGTSLFWDPVWCSG